MAESSINFTYELIDVLTGTIWNVNPMKGREYKIVITVPNFAQLKMVALGMVFVKESPTAIALRPLSNKGGGNYEFIYNMTDMDKNVMIGIDGLDSSMHHVRRLSPNVITPVNLKLIVPPYTGVTLYESKLFTIDVAVVNLAMVEQDLDIQIVDDKNFAQVPVLLSSIIKPGENWTGQFVIKGGLMGETTKVTITARPYLESGQYGNGPSEYRQFTVYTNLTASSTTSSTSDITSSTLITNTLAAQPVQNSGTTQPLTVTATDGLSKYGQGATESSRSENGFNKGVIITVAIVSGVSGGTLVGIAGLVIWGLLFRKLMRTTRSNSVQPQPQSKSAVVRTDGLR